jgi:hypothetical protein
MNKESFPSPEFYQMYQHQPFFLIADASYSRMYLALTAGAEPFVKSYVSTCPHKQQKDCKCKCFLNFLKDGKMFRLVDGVLKEVISESTYRERLNSGAG